MAPTTASVMATFKPAKISGSARGKEILRNICQEEKPTTLPRRSISRGVDLSLTTVEMTTGKNATRKAINDLRKESEAEPYNEERRNRNLRHRLRRHKEGV